MLGERRRHFAAPVQEIEVGRIMVNPVNWGWLGDAKIARDHVIPGMQESEWCDIAAVASRDLDRAKRIASALGVPKAYGSYEELLADPEIEAVYNPLPNHLHVPWSVKAAEAGKHVLCEKPIALSAAEARTLVAARDRCGVLIEEAFMVHSNPQWLRARELVREGAIGDLRAAQWSFAYRLMDPHNVRNMPDIGGGGVYDIGCYPITTCRFVFESEPKRLVALLDRDPDFGTDRLASVILDFGEGRQASFLCSTQIALHQRATFLGTGGRITVEIPCNSPPKTPYRLLVDEGKELGDKSARVETFQGDQYMIQGEEFSKAVRGEEALVTPLEDAVLNMAVIDAVFRSAESGRWEDVSSQ